MKIFAYVVFVLLDGGLSFFTYGCPGYGFCSPGSSVASLRESSGAVWKYVEGRGFNPDNITVAEYRVAVVACGPVNGHCAAGCTAFCKIQFLNS